MSPGMDTDYKPLLSPSLGEPSQEHSQESGKQILKDFPELSGTHIKSDAERYYIYEKKVFEKNVMLASEPITYNYSVNSVAFHPSDELIAAGSDYTTTTLCKIIKYAIFGLYDTKRVATMKGVLDGKSQAVRSVAFHPNGELLATGGGTNVIIWEIIKEGFFSSSYKAVNKCTIETGYVVKSVAFHRSGRLLAIGGNNINVNLWQLSPDYSLATCVATLEGHSSPVVSVAFHPNGKLLATGSFDKTAKLWRLSPEYSSADYVETLKGHSSGVTSVAFHPTALILATGSHDSTVKLWRTWLADCVATLQGHSNYVNSVAFHPTAPLLATGSQDKTAKLWRLSSDNSSATCVATVYFDSFVNSVSFHPTKLFLVTGESNGYMKLWDIEKLEKGAQKKKYELPQETGLSGGSIIRHHKKRLSRKLKRYASKRIKKNRNRNKYKKSKKVKTKTRRYRKFR